jgi:hypothetical protein
MSAQPPYYSSVNPLWQEGRAWGVNEERQRILALIDTRDWYQATFESNEFGNDELLIALIKGENE